MTGKRNILVLVDSENSELGALHHALALAERIKAGVTVLRIEPLEEKTTLSDLVDDAMYELVRRAREAGIPISCNTLRDSSEDSVLSFVQEQDVEVLVVGETERHWEKNLLRMKSRIPTQIIRVSEKNEPVRRTLKKGSRKWRS